MVKLFICVALVFLRLLSLGFANEYEVVPVPEWVVAISIDEPEKTPDEIISDGVYDLLVDTQENMVLGEREKFSRFVMQVVNQNGVTHASQVSIRFDPSYQELLIHGIYVYRNAERIDQLQLENISVLQREEDLEAQIYDGSKIFNAILEDVRVGDRIEYSYTLRGENPILKEMYGRALGMQWGVPVYKLSHRLLWPNNKKLFIKQHGGNFIPEVNDFDGYKEYFFLSNNIPGLNVDSNLPTWYDPYPWVQLSAVEYWGDVVNWGVDLYRKPEVLAGTIQEKIEEINSQYITKEEKTMAALRFVQDEVRYMGIEIGPHSYRPHDPVIVLDRRFGDCKDKTYLLQELLRGLGIESYPALVSTQYYEHVKTWHPSHLVFNHVILNVVVDDVVYWLDPTRTFQRGELRYVYQPDYKYALVLKPGNDNLVKMNVRQYGLPSKSILERFDLRDGYDGLVYLTVQTTYYGSLADYMRNYVSRKSQKDIGKDYVNYYASVYPNIAVHEDVSWADDGINNVFVVSESYEIKDFWTRLDGEMKEVECIFYPLEIGDLYVAPATRVRTMPLAISHPVYYLFVSEIQLPDEWHIEETSTHIENAAVSFDKTVSYDKETLTFRYVYRTKVDALLPEDVPEYLETMGHVEDELGYELYNNLSIDDGVVELNWYMVYVAIFIVFVAIFSAFRVFRYNPEVDVRSEDEQKLHGIEGWLIVVAFGIIMQPILLLADMGPLSENFDLHTWRALTDPTSEMYHALWGPVFIFELIVNIFWFVFSLLMLILFFKKRSSFPRVYIIYLMATLLAQIGIQVIAHWIPIAEMEWDSGAIGEIVRRAIVVFIWTSYFLSSKRVAGTFIKRMTPTQ